jgi:hypothetical protein
MSLPQSGAVAWCTIANLMALLPKRRIKAIDQAVNGGARLRPARQQNLNAGWKRRRGA